MERHSSAALRQEALPMAPPRQAGPKESQPQESQAKESQLEPDASWAPPAGTGEEGFRGPQVCKVVGITYRQLDYWARTGLLRPSITDAKGSGSQRVYSYTDLVQLKVIKQLLDAGVSLRSTRRAIECLRSSGGALASASLVIADDRTVLANTGEELFDLLRGGQGVLNIVLGMERIVGEVDAAITEIGKRAEAGRDGAARPSSRSRKAALGA
jgi:DNA-binding transcriptional MerR regulator